MPTIECTCLECGTTFFRSRAKVLSRAGGRTFCSRECRFASLEHIVQILHPVETESRIVAAFNFRGYIDDSGSPTYNN